MSTHPHPPAPSRADWTGAALVALGLFVLYAASASRSVALEDDGLFVLSSYFFGVEHAPGYPLFTLMGRLFTLIPIGSVAYRVHLASAFFGALTCGALWMCVRFLVQGRLAATLAALALGLSPVFWSQSIVAEVYTLNTFLYLVLIYLGLRACPAAGAAAEGARFLPWMAFVFGLSLSNHWPLMLLGAPAFAVLLWPVRQALLRRLPLLLFLFGLGLVPYAWLVLLSWSGLPISFYGPIESLSEFWHFVSRAGYAEVDASPAATWVDRLKFFQFLATQLVVQFAGIGTALAVLGFMLQRRAFGARISGFLALAFVMPTVVLLLLLNFEYNSVSKHTFHVYPLPAYAVAALWMALGFSWLVQRLSLAPARRMAGVAVVLAAIFAVASGPNLRADRDWAARYAKAVIDTLPRDAILFVKGDADVGAIGYFHIVEHWRPDITLYQSKGLVLGNRLFHPLRTTRETAERKVIDFIEQQGSPVAFTAEFAGNYALRDRWLYIEVDKSSRDPQRQTVDIPEQAVRFFEESVLEPRQSNAWIAYHQDELRRRYAMLLGRSMPSASALDERRKRHFEALSRDFHGALGLAEGLMANRQRYAAGVVHDLLNRARELMPPDAPKRYQSDIFYLRGLLRLDLGDKPGAVQDLDMAVSIWPMRDNRALQPLEDLYRERGDKTGLVSVRERLKRPRP
jgi:hypothetical protein